MPKDIVEGKIIGGKILAYDCGQGVGILFFNPYVRNEAEEETDEVAVFVSRGDKSKLLNTGVNKFSSDIFENCFKDINDEAFYAIEEEVNTPHELYTVCFQAAYTGNADKLEKLKGSRKLLIKFIEDNLRQDS